MFSFFAFIENILPISFLLSIVGVLLSRFRYVLKFEFCMHLQLCIDAFRHTCIVICIVICTIAAVVNAYRTISLSFSFCFECTLMVEWKHWRF